VEALSKQAPCLASVVVVAAAAAAPGRVWVVGACVCVCVGVNKCCGVLSRRARCVCCLSVCLPVLSQESPPLLPCRRRKGIVAAGWPRRMDDGGIARAGSEKKSRRGSWRSVVHNRRPGQQARIGFEGVKRRWWWWWWWWW
jgi:hypothetical protein